LGAVGLLRIVRPSEQREELAMPTLHIEHPVTDFARWRAAFDRLAGARREAGVRAHRVQRPVGNPAYVVVDLEFDTDQAALAFLHFLKTRVWATPEDSPALAGPPRTMVLETVATTWSAESLTGARSD
jgi:hypothetical protein